MPRYFFHLYAGSKVVDEEGMELPDFGAARGHAVRCAHDLACADIRAGCLYLDHYIEVTDENGSAVVSLSFRDSFRLVG